MSEPRTTSKMHTKRQIIKLYRDILYGPQPYMLLTPLTSEQLVGANVSQVERVDQTSNKPATEKKNKVQKEKKVKDKKRLNKKQRTPNLGSSNALCSDFTTHKFEFLKLHHKTHGIHCNKYRDFKLQDNNDYTAQNNDEEDKTDSTQNELNQIKDTVEAQPASQELVTSDSKSSTTEVAVPEMTNSDVEFQSYFSQQLELLVSTLSDSFMNMKITDDEDTCSNNDEEVKDVESKNVEANRENFKDSNGLITPDWIKNTKYSKVYEDIAKNPYFSLNLSVMEDLNLGMQAARDVVDFKNIMVKSFSGTEQENRDIVVTSLDVVYEKCPPVYTTEEIEANELFQAFVRSAEAGGVKYEVVADGSFYYE